MTDTRPQPRSGAEPGESLDGFLATAVAAARAGGATGSLAQAPLMPAPTSAGVLGMARTMRA